MEIQNNYLQHHGVKGQKWGVRKEPEETAKSRNSFDDEMLNYERQQAKLQKKEEKKQKRERAKKIFFGVALTTAGIAVVAALIKKFGNKKPATQVISENKATISAGKEYVTGYNKAKLIQLGSSRTLGVKNYMGKKRTYNINASSVSSMRRGAKMFRTMTSWR